MAYTTIDDPTIYFTTNLRSGLYGGSDTAFDIGFQPDWIWNKKRSGTGVHSIFDSVRGFGSSGKVIYTNSGNVEATNALIKSVSSTGFTVTASSDDTGTMVDWCWKAGTSFSNSSGSNGADLASSGSYNRDAGFSIVTFTGNATADQQIYHGLNSVPKWMILKNRTNSNGESWAVYHASMGNTYRVNLNTTGARSNSDSEEFWANTTPTSTVLSIGRQDQVNGSGNTHVVYCFSEVKGYSKFSSYVGNGSSDGTFVYTGFRPAWLLFKGNNTSNWQLWDNKRDTINPVEKALHPDITNTASTDQDIDFLSNGFKIRGSVAHINGSGVDFYYAAFAESPFVNSNGIPNNAR